MFECLSYSRHFGSPEVAATKNHSPFATDEEAKADRDAKYRELKACGLKVRRSVLKGQFRQYWGWQEVCGITAPVYELYVEK